MENTQFLFYDQERLAHQEEVVALVWMFVIRESSVAEP